MIRISTDSTSDLDYLFAENNIAVMPLCVVLGDKTLSDGVDVTPDDIYAFVNETGKLPKTAARNEYDYDEYFKSIQKNGETIIHIAFSSELSTCCHCAKTAAAKMNGVYVVDSKSLSTGCGLLVMKAVDLLAEGKNAEEIVQILEEKVPFVQASFIVSTMKYLYKGGRCSKLESFAATALKIMPSLQLVNGKIAVGKKYMGNILKNCDKYVLDVLKQYNKPDKTRAFITYTKNTDEKIVAKIEQALLANSQFDKVYKTHAGSTVTCHCGAGTIGILYLNDGE